MPHPRSLVPAFALLVLLVVLGTPGRAVAAGSGWSRAAQSLTRGTNAIGPAPLRSAAFTLRRSTLQGQLDPAPTERRGVTRGRLPIVELPAPDGTLRPFRVAESPVMEPGLAAKIPGFTSYSAVGVDDPTATARLDLSPLGFHATVRSAGGSWFVDPAGGLDPDRHLAYRGTAREAVPAEPDTLAGGTAGPVGRAARPTPGGIVSRREYRLALASDPSYAAAFPGAGGVDFAKAALVDRADQLYGDDLAIKLVLITGNDKLNFSTQLAFRAAGYTSATCTGATLDANQLAIDTKIGAANYDVGHLVSASPGGGLASLQAVGRDGVKAQGCTGVADPRGDGFAIDYFAHELGHEFGAEHTFTGQAGNCGSGNRDDDAAVEPGSGSSVMAYAGICGEDDLQAHSDPYFSQRSIVEIQAYVGSNQGAGARNGGTVIATTNHAPVVSAPATRAIPPRTPFTLTGGASDPDGNPLVLSWEQNDDGPGSELTSNSKPSGALFRQFGAAAVENPLLSPAPGQNLATAAGATRSFPDLAQVAAGNTNAATGSCPAASSPPSAAQVECFSEFLPTSARALHFRLTARDQVLGGGGESSADTTVTVAGTSPFRVTSQSAPATVNGFAPVPVTWDVAGTDGAPFGVANVRILYSTDGGESFPTVVSASTPNDGARTVTVPDVSTTQGRFRVEAVGNGFFDLSAADLSVTAVGGPPPPDPDPDAVPGGTPATATAAATAAAAATAPAAGPGRQPPRVATPVRTGDAAKFPAKLRVLRAGVRSGDLDVLSEITRRASGRVQVSYRSAGRTTRFTAPITDGRIRFRHRLRGAAARKPTGIFTLTYVGDEDVRADAVRLRAANGRAGLRRGRTGIAGGILGVSGTTTPRARGVVRIRLEYVVAGALVTRSLSAPIVAGTWTYSERFTAAVGSEGVQLSLQYTGYEPRHLRGEQSSKRVVPG